jgi:hypothetical protein
MTKRIKQNKFIKNLKGCINLLSVLGLNKWIWKWRFENDPLTLSLTHIHTLCLSFSSEWKQSKQSSKENLNLICRSASDSFLMKSHSFFEEILLIST